MATDAQGSGIQSLWRTVLSIWIAMAVLAAVAHALQAAACSAILRDRPTQALYPRFPEQSVAMMHTPFRSVVK